MGKLNHDLAALGWDNPKRRVSEGAVIRICADHLRLSHHHLFFQIYLYPESLTSHKFFPFSQERIIQLQKQNQFIHNFTSEKMNSETKSKAEERYKNSSLRLQNVTRNHLGPLSFPKFEVIEGTENKAKALREALDNVILARSEIKKKQQSKKRIGDIVLSWFRASYPFVNIAITLTKDATTVIPTRYTADIYLRYRL